MNANVLYFPADVQITSDFQRSTQHSTLVEYGSDGARQAAGFYGPAGIRKRTFTTTWLLEADRERVEGFLNAQRGQLGKWFLYDPVTQAFAGVPVGTLDGVAQTFIIPYLGIDPVTGADLLLSTFKLYKNGSLLNRGTDYSATALIQPQVVGSVRGPYNIVAGTNDVVEVTADDSGLHSITLTPGAARTAFDIVTDLSGHLGVTGSAQIINGAVRIRDGTPGILAGGWLQVGSPANNANATLGLNTLRHFCGGEYQVSVVNPNNPGDVLTADFTGRQRLTVALAVDEIVERVVPNLAIPMWQFSIPVREVI